MFTLKKRQDIAFGMAVLGAAGVLIGLVWHSYLLMAVTGPLGAGIGWFVGWLGGRRYLLIVCLGMALGAALGFQSGDRDILIISAGSGAAIAGFLGAQLELFAGKR
ncbi:MAG: hypothetical protein ACE5GQ_05915 [Nitrospinales bacterium]